jgi:hypothetical protein
MRLFFDRENRQTSARTVGAAIDEAAALARARDRLVVDVLVDGAAWTVAEIASHDHRARSADEVRVETVERASLVRGALDEAETALSDADAFQQSAAEMLQRGDDAAWRRLGEALDQWATVHAAARAAEEALAGAPGAEAAARAVPRLAAQLQSIRTALLARDTVGLADALLYEMPDTVAAWRGLLAAMRERTLADPPAPPHREGSR